MIFDEIIAGWTNYVFPNKEVEEVAKKRLKICCGCDKISDRNYCKICHCFMPAKVRSLKSKCPLRLWI